MCSIYIINDNSIHRPGTIMLVGLQAPIVHPDPYARPASSTMHSKLELQAVGGNALPRPES